MQQQQPAEIKQQPPSQLQSNNRHQSATIGTIVDYVPASKLSSAKFASSIYHKNQQKRPEQLDEQQRVTIQDEKVGHFDREKYYYSSLDESKQVAMTENCSCLCHERLVNTQAAKSNNKLDTESKSLQSVAKLDDGLVKLDKDNQFKEKCHTALPQPPKVAEQGAEALSQVNAEGAREATGPNNTLSAQTNFKSASIDNCPAALYCLKCKRINQMLCQQQQQQQQNSGIIVNDQAASICKPLRSDKLATNATGVARLAHDHDPGKNHRSSTTSDIQCSSMASCSRTSSLVLDLDNQHDDLMMVSVSNLVTNSMVGSGGGGSQPPHKCRQLNSSSLTASCNEISQQSGGRTSSTNGARTLDRARDETGGDKLAAAKCPSGHNHSAASEPNYINQDDRRSSATCDCCACNCCDMNLNYYEEEAEEVGATSNDAERTKSGNSGNQREGNCADDQRGREQTDASGMNLNSGNKCDQADESGNIHCGQQNGGIVCLSSQNQAQSKQPKELVQRVTIDDRGLIASNIVVGRNQHHELSHQDSFDSDAIVKQANETYKRIVANNFGGNCKGAASAPFNAGSAGGGGQVPRSPRLIAICWRRLMALQQHTRLFTRRQGSLQPTIESSETHYDGEPDSPEHANTNKLVLSCKLCHCPVKTGSNGRRQVSLRAYSEQSGDIEANELSCEANADDDNDDYDDGTGANNDIIVASNFANLKPNNKDSLLIAVASTTNIVVSTTVRQAAAPAIRPTTKTITTKTTPTNASSSSPIKGSNQQHQSNVGLQNHATNMEGVESKRERKAAKTLAIITGVFVMCWLPFFIMAILMPLLQLKPHKYLFAFLLWLGYVNSMLNPIIYTIFSPDFRKAFKRLLCAIDDNSRTGGRNNKGRSNHQAKFSGNHANWNGGQRRSNAVVQNFS